jgi:hypothetical protein
MTSKGKKVITSFAVFFGFVVLATQETDDFLLRNVRVHVEHKKSLELEMNEVRLKLVAFVLRAVHELVVVVELF